jgi:hypothetical protein
MMEGKSISADEAGRIYLTEAEKRLPFDDLLNLLKFKGYQISDATAYRAKARGWFMKPGYINESNRTSGKRVYLTSEERLLPGAVLARRFGFTPPVGILAKKRGFFEVNSINKHLVRIPKDRSLGPEEKILAGGDDLPNRITSLPDGRKISGMTIKEISETLNLESKAAGRARRRGFINLLTWPLKKRAELAERLKTFESPMENNPTGRGGVE